MHKDWYALIKSQNPTIKAGIVQSFQEPRQEAALAAKADVIADLSYMGLLKISGVDASKFLQGQLSCDLDQINQDSSQLGAYCNQQGRMISTFRGYKIDEDYYLYMPQSIIEANKAQLQKYALFSKVSLVDASDEKVCVGLSGPKAEQFLTQYFSRKPKQTNQVIVNKSIVVSRVQGALPRYVLIAPYEPMANFWQAMQPQVASIAQIGWRLLNIMAGVPSIYPQTQEQFIPHRVNYHLLKGLNFEKGCYLGQEIIARFHYRATFKHQLYRLWLSNDQVYAPGTQIYDENKRTIGHIVDQVLDPVSGSQALIVMPIAAVGQQIFMPGHIHVSSKLLGLPYRLNNRD